MEKVREFLYQAFAVILFLLALSLLFYQAEELWTLLDTAFEQLKYRIIYS